MKLQNIEQLWEAMRCYENTANGVGAPLSNTSGSTNIGIGYYAGSNLTTGNNNINIGSPANAGDSGTIRIGTNGVQTATFIAGILRNPWLRKSALRPAISG
jgi:hypothetical protein